MIDWGQVSLILGAVGAGPIMTTLLNRRGSRADARNRETEATVKEVDYLRSILEELRLDSAEKSARLKLVEDRVDQLEANDRDTLRRIAIHEAWDVLAHQALLRGNPDYPAPPPLTGQPSSTQTTVMTVPITAVLSDEEASAGS